MQGRSTLHLNISFAPIQLIQRLTIVINPVQPAVTTATGAIAVIKTSEQPYLQIVPAQCQLYFYM